MRIPSSPYRPLACLAASLLASVATIPDAGAAGFAVMITPPRLELRAQPGEVVRQVIQVTNVANATTRLSVQTADWQLGEDDSVLFENPLAADSCRPWTALEARELELGAGGRRRFRFEVAVPEEAPARECRFAIMFEGEPEQVESLPFPVSGRIGVIVYLTVGNARAQLELVESTVVEFQGRWLPALMVTNTGNAHTRLGGFINGRDEAGRTHSFAPSDLPVLPGRTRTVVLQPQVPEGDTSPEIEYPLRLTGRLDWSGQRLDVDQVFATE
jgi:fimbrial chaperone protein